YQELRARIQETDLSVPERRDGYFYYSRTEAGRQYPIFCRRAGSLDAAEEIILDQNALAEDHPYFRVGAMEVSPDHQYLAYSVDTSGSEAYAVYIKDLATGAPLPETLANAAANLAWATDGRTLFYLTLDEARRPCRLQRHHLDTNPEHDALVFFEPDG